jgi:hypothetical protein
MDIVHFTRRGILALFTAISASCSSSPDAGDSPGVEATSGAGGSAAMTESAGSSGGGSPSNGGSGAGGSMVMLGGGGGAAGSGGKVATSDGGAVTLPDAGVPHVIKGCPSAAQGGPAAAFVWENVTPKEVCLTCLKSQNNNANFGTASVLINPQDPSIVYLGTEEWGFYKSTDCGSTWSKTNNGKNGDALDKGSQWTLLVDPIDPQVLYTNSGFGVSGVFKSTNAGVDWEQVLTGDAAKVAPYGGFMGTYSMDPGDHRHILASFHAACSAPMASACFVETKDGGATWTARNGDPSWNGGEHTILEFLDSTTWLFGNQDGMWRSTDSGTTWKQLSGKHSIVHHQQLYRPKPGVYFQTSVEGLIYSNDNGVSWSLLAGSPQAAVGVVGDGVSVFTSRAGPWQVPGGTPDKPYFTVSEANPTAQPMAKMESPMMVDGGLFMAYDPDHHIVYSSNFPAGVWRVVVGGGAKP